MSDRSDPAQTAAEALVALGWPVEPTEDFEAWQIGCLIWTDEDLMKLALRQGVVLPPDRLQ